ncbi:3-methyl-2-oxobutanoate hydroxymethyltransferase [hydrothermal vent metagenome]|uniref:3-methyl-2-oxobutanoate hydroxymethyltransferase n=1 Tax=hydrothermal vent metagenome TaxID=652676 RepID=A0A3B1AII7_9ZZZZ
MSRITTSTLRKMKQAGEKITCLTAYDASFAQILVEEGVEILLVGDSLGMILQGRDSTLPVTLDEMIYHTQMVRTASQGVLVMADLPFMSYATPVQALTSAGRLMKEGGAHMVKLEGGALMVETAGLLAEHGIPVCAHLGLLPQSVNKLGGYKVQGRDEKQAEVMLLDARAMEDAGADILLLECVPSLLAAEITAAVDIPLIGIGAGPQCDAQVLVLYDMLGITPGKRPRFSKDFLQEADDIRGAVRAYVQAVKDGSFPADEHSF